MQKVKNVFLFLLLSFSLLGTNMQAIASYGGDDCHDCENCDCENCEDCDCEDCEDCDCENCEDCDCENCDCGDCAGCNHEDRGYYGDRKDHERCYGGYYAYPQRRGNGKLDIKYWSSCDDMEDFIPEGATIRVEGGIDVYIVKYQNGKMFKRLVLNPEVFENYEHLRWEDVLNVSQEVMNRFTNSNLVRSEESGKVYKLYPNGDSGTKRLVKYHGDLWNKIDWDSVYTINGCDENSYTTSSPID